jgi:hypothetical protein
MTFAIEPTDTVVFTGSQDECEEYVREQDEEDEEEEPQMRRTASWGGINPDLEYDA